MSLVSLKHVIENHSERERDVMESMVGIINCDNDRKEMMGYTIDQGLKYVDKFDINGETYRVEIGRHIKPELSEGKVYRFPVLNTSDLRITRLNNKDLSEPSIKIVLTVDEHKNIIATDIDVKHEEYGEFDYTTIAELLVKFIGV